MKPRVFRSVTHMWICTHGPYTTFHTSWSEAMRHALNWVRVIRSQINPMDSTNSFGS